MPGTKWVKYGNKYNKDLEKTKFNLRWTIQRHSADTERFKYIHIVQIFFNNPILIANLIWEV